MYLRHAPGRGCCHRLRHRHFSLSTRGWWGWFEFVDFRCRASTALWFLDSVISLLGTFLGKSFVHMFVVKVALISIRMSRCFTNTGLPRTGVTWLTSLWWAALLAYDVSLAAIFWSRSKREKHSWNSRISGGYVLPVPNRNFHNMNNIGYFQSKMLDMKHIHRFSMIFKCLVGESGESVVTLQSTPSIYLPGI